MLLPHILKKVVSLKSNDLNSYFILLQICVLQTWILEGSSVHNAISLALCDAEDSTRPRHWHNLRHMFRLSSDSTTVSWFWREWVHFTGLLSKVIWVLSTHYWTSMLTLTILNQLLTGNDLTYWNISLISLRIFIAFSVACYQHFGTLCVCMYVLWR